MSTKHPQWEMEVSKFIDNIIGYCGQQFPRRCNTCGLEYADFVDYVERTEPVGLACFDANQPDADPIGTLSLVNCACQSTIALQCGDKTTEMYHAFMTTLKSDASRLGVPVEEVLVELRDRIRVQACAAKPTGAL